MERHQTLSGKTSSVGIVRNRLRFFPETATGSPFTFGTEYFGIWLKRKSFIKKKQILKKRMNRMNDHYENEWKREEKLTQDQWLLVNH